MRAGPTPVDGEVTGTTPEPPEPRTSPEWQPPAGPLDEEAVAIVAASALLVVSSADAHGSGDVTVQAGPPGFVAVLDPGHLAYPDLGVDPVTASRSNIAERPQVALLLVGADATGERRALHVNGTARVVPDVELTAEHPHLPTEPVPGRATDVRIVVEVGDVYPLAGDDVPPVMPLAAPTAPTAPTAPAAPAAPTAPTAPTAAGGSGPPTGPPGTARGTSSGVSRPLPLLLGIVVLALVAAVIGLVLARPPAEGTAAPAPPPAAPALNGPPTGYGRVVDVPDPATVVVDVAGTPTRVGVLGLDAAGVPGCATADAVAFARETLQGQSVTLVPDPTLPPTPEVRAYVVLPTQLSYTDAAIRAGWGVASSDTLYRPGFDAAQDEARTAELGMWGPPCVR